MTETTTTASSPPHLKNSKPTKQRLLSLDVLRGITIIGMIVVNTPGSWSYMYPPLQHAEWHGLTPTDLVFPFFLFMVGISITLALGRRVASGVPLGGVVFKIVKRFFIIYALGLFLALFPAFDFENLRYVGVLPRIAVVYLVCSLLFLKLSWRGVAWLSGITLVIYWLMMVLIPVPGVGKANLEPGTNLAAWLDELLVPGRMYRVTWDPEGFLSTFPAIVTGFTGVLTGYWLRSSKSVEHKIIGMMVAGVLTCLIGYLWHQGFPVNKNLWSSSYVLVSSGMALLLLGTLYWFIDVKHYRGWTPFFVAFGMNAITAYVLHGTLIDAFHIPINETGETLRGSSFQGLVQLGLQPELASFVWALLYLLLCFIPIWIMYRRNIIVKI
ncbi:acyltransferase family protein [Tunicatimonas pelagia]|uniref:acyltransferase family protein n=1 Tax=Tunicatimonas pelagia TaxID=931531 RepID=UPI00266693D5|nr:DUF5009 domain-containing protein [Tunicatimonas pelagia]WKN44781.1 DUF5009 domain-containing protein [Tunicatimonas pelagia]